MKEENQLKKHRGKWLKTKMESCGYTQEMIIASTQISRTTLWRYFKKEDLPFHLMKDITDVMKVDILLDFPEARFVLQEPPKNYEALYLRTLELAAEQAEIIENLERQNFELNNQNGTLTRQINLLNEGK